MFIYIITGLLCFGAGQLVGGYFARKQAEFMFYAMKRGFEGYQEAVKAVLMRDHGVDLSLVDKAAIKWAAENTVDKMQKFVEERLKNAPKTDEGSGS
jgi:hypothetical protein